MGAMGRFLGSLTVEGRDAVISTASWYWDLPGGGYRQGDHCLVSASGLVWGTYSALRAYPIPATAYDDACRRFGGERIVRAIKLRAARLNGCDPSSISSLTKDLGAAVVEVGAVSETVSA